MEAVEISSPTVGSPVPGSPWEGVPSPADATWQGPDGCGEMLTVRWNKDPLDVSAFAGKWELPQVVRLAGKEYKDFDASDSPLDVHQPLLLYNVRRCTKLLASCVKWDEGVRKYTQDGVNLVIPLNYNGWFSFLQEGGHNDACYRTIEAVSEGKPDSFLACTAITAYSYKKGRSGGKVYYKEHVPPGEVFNVGSIVVESIADDNSAALGCCWRGKARDKELFYLQCTDAFGKELLLPFDAAGEFHKIGSPGSPEENAVFQLNDVARCVQFPTAMRLVYGEPPSAAECEFTHNVRLEEMYFEESLIASTLFEDKITMIEFPTDSEIQFIRASNWEDIHTSWVVTSNLAYCDQNIDAYNTGMKILQSVFKSHKDENSNIQPQSKLNFSVDSPVDNETQDCEDQCGQNSEAQNSEVQNCEGQDSEGHQNDAFDIEDDSTVEDNSIMRKSKSSSFFDKHFSLGRSTNREITVRHSSSIQERVLPVPPVLPPRNSAPNLQALLLEQTTPPAGAVTVCRPNTPQTIFSEDPDYETIPYFKKATPNSRSDTETPSRRMLAVDFKKLSPEAPPSLPERDFPRGADAATLQLGSVHDEEGYLTPIEFRKQLTNYRSSIGYDMHRGEPASPIADSENYANTLLLRVPPAPVPPRLPPTTPPMSLQNEERRHNPPLQRALSLVQQSASSPALGHPASSLCENQLDVNLSTYDEARLHSFLSDTIQELQRRQSKTGSDSRLTAEHGASRSDTASYKSSSAVKAKPPDPPETVEELNEFLENIFDVDKEDDEEEEEDSGEGCGSCEVDDDHAGGSEKPVSIGERLPDETRSTLFIRQESGRTDSGVMVNPTSSTSDQQRPPEGEYIYKTFSDCSWTPPDNLAVMSVEEVALCLRYIGMRERIVLRFCEEQIDGKQLMELDQEMLNCFPELNVFEKKKIIDFLHGWRPKRFATDC